MNFIHGEGSTVKTKIIQTEITLHVTDLQVSVDSDLVTEGQTVTLTYVAYESAGIVTLSSVLIPVVLLVVCAALWMIKKNQPNLKRPQEKEKNIENDTMYENDQTLVDWQDGSEYTCVYFRLHSKLHCKTFAEDTECHMTLLLPPSEQYVCT
ncbi:transmembrane and immunoglobulin domain-containing 1-like protein [Labeo rohita]|nr:transmembrane and immunoglobulin domain-containing 1-like protein [Labeo rohita]RXN23044.1 transmembrane and immunoglobulin domain-containing 1-like protein [Labeo rohita]